MKLIYKGITYPNLICSNENIEIQAVLIPEVTGDYFLSTIDSEGGYKLIEFVAESDVQIKP